MAALLALALPSPASAAGAHAARLLTPVTGPSFQGADNSSWPNADPTSAIGPDSFIEMVDFQVAIYDRSGALITSAPMWTLFGGDQFSLNDAQSQVMWDPATNRFYYELLFGDTFEIGFSKGSSPTSVPGDFCNYAVDYGYATGPDFPDFPRLGDTRDSLLIGVNRLQLTGDATIQTGSDVDWMTKPAGTGTITTCPARSAFETGRVAGLAVAGSPVNAPVPAQQTDPSTTGWVVSIPSTTTTHQFQQLDLFKVAENADGTPSIPTNATSTVSVAGFSQPPAAQEPGGAVNSLDTLDGRLLNAVTAVDPARSNATALWAAHAVGNGRTGFADRAESRWYEINVAGASLFQSGKATSSTANVFNPSISPDRAVNGASAAFGSDMVMSFDTSSASTGPDIQMVSKVGNNPQSGFVPVKTSPGPDQGVECLGFCLWGESGSASPDPAASPAGSEGDVWLTNLWSRGGGVSSTMSEWSTWDWEAMP